MNYLTCPDTSCSHQVQVVGDHSNTIHEGAQVFCNRCGEEYAVKVMDYSQTVNGVATDCSVLFLERKDAS